MRWRDRGMRCRPFQRQHQRDPRHVVAIFVHCGRIQLTIPPRRSGAEFSGDVDALHFLRGRVGAMDWIAADDVLPADERTVGVDRARVVLEERAGNSEAEILLAERTRVP